MGVSKRLWILFVIVIPLIFAAVITIVVLQAMDKNVGDELKSIGSHIPVISSWIEGDEEGADRENSAKEVERLTQLIQEKDNEIAALEEKLLDKDEEATQQKEEIARLKQQLEEDEPLQQTREQNIKKTGELLLAMSPKDAAEIMADMDNDDIIALLESFDADDMGRILAKMEPERASELTSLLLAN